MRWSLVCLLASFPVLLHAGASNAELSCVATNTSGSGITLKGDIPGDTAEFNLTLTNRHGARVWSDADGSAHSVIAFSKGVFTLTLQFNDGAELVLYAIPNTVKAKGGDARLVDARIAARAAPRAQTRFHRKCLCAKCADALYISSFGVSLFYMWSISVLLKVRTLESRKIDWRTPRVHQLPSNFVALMDGTSGKGQIWPF